MGDSQKSYSILPKGDTVSGKMLPVHFRVRRGPLGYLSSMTKSFFYFRLIKPSLLKFITNFRMVHEDSGWPRARLLLLRGDRFYGFILSQDYYVTWASEKEKKELNCSAHNSRKKQDFPSNIRMAILLIYQFHLSFVWKSSTSS